MDIRTAPCTDDLDFTNKLVVDMLPMYFSDSVDASIENIRNEYQNTKNDCFLPAIGRMEQCLFRLYEAKYIVLPHKSDLDLLGYAFDDSYHAAVNAEVEKSFDKAYAQSEYDTALGLVREKKYDEAGMHFKCAAINGNAAAQYNYGVSVASGEVGEPDTTEGAFWYFLAAKGGYAKAMVNLAIAYRNGTGVYPDGFMMTYWYARAATIPFPYAAYNLGLSLMNEEVLGGNSIIGRQVKLFSEQLEDTVAREYVTDIAYKVINVISDRTFNI